MAQTKCLFLTGSFILLLAAGLLRAQDSNSDAIDSPTSSSSSSLARDFGFFNGTSSVTIRQSTWDLRLSKEVTFRTCSEEGSFLFQKAANPSTQGFSQFSLHLNNGTVVFEWTVTSSSDDVTSQSDSEASQQMTSISVGEGLGNNEQYTVKLKSYLGTVFLNVSQLSRGLLYSAVVANSTFNTELLSASISSSDLTVGQNFTGCLYAGPGVNFKGDNVLANKVSWNYCPLQTTPGCTTADQNDCYQQPCLNGGTCVDMFQTYRCECPRNFNGTNCQEDLARQYGCMVSPCENNATCENVTDFSPGALPYRCVCPTGFTGVNCETLLNQCEKSPPPCLHGTCSSNVNSYTCDCSGTGFRGQNCSEDINECREGTPCGSGSCFNIPGSYSCQCPLGSDGPKCQDINECVSDPCQNGATCTQGVNNYTCTCPGGFRGRNCEENIDDCVPNPCRGQFVECRDGIMTYTCECQAGYQNVSGDCQDIDECQSNPCQNSATCRNNINSYSCDCVPGFTDVNCQTNIDDCASNPCQNSATCVDGINAFTCLCVPGFTSSNCSVDIDDCLNHQCQNAATCNDAVNNYTCSCVNGWTGDRCEVNIDDCASNPCENSATCTDLVAAYNCTCLLGFTGDRCETNIDDCDPDPCENNGNCTDLVNDYHCQCPTNRMGKNCSEMYDACSFLPCQNNATCSTTPPQQEYTCQCPTGFTGVNCQTNIDDCVGNTCQSFEVCYDGIDTYTCGCPRGYEGVNCSQEIDECASDPCQNGATCGDYIDFYNCSCPAAGNFMGYTTGYSGVNCENDINECEYDPPICLNGGNCKNSIGSYVCYCPGSSNDGKLVTGPNCEIVTSYCTVTGNSACQNGATCINAERDYFCQCVPGFTDKNCTTNIDECASNPCQYGGTCNDGINGYNCTCIPGITGANCEINIDDCANDPCGPGTCHDLINDYECNCTDTGFRGDNCEININDCLPGICQNNASCEDGIKDYTCACKPGYTGKNCQTDIQECDSNPCQYNGRCLEYSDRSLYGQGHPNFTVFSYDDAAGYLCECIPGIEGVNCEINIEDCVEGVCKNGATCVDGINTYTCQCAPGYTGVHCETEINECELYTPCQNNATCTDLIADYSCECVAFDANRPNRNLYGGKNCSVYLSGCDNNKQCQNGHCVPFLQSENPVTHDFRCECDTGFTGRFCDVSTTMTFSSNGSSVTFTNTSLNTLPLFSFRFKTTLVNALLAVYTLTPSTFVAVEMEDGMLIVVYNDDSSSTPTRLKETVDTQEHLNNEEWHSVTLNLLHNISLAVVSDSCGTERCMQQLLYPGSSQPSVNSAGVMLGEVDGSVMTKTATQSLYAGCMEDIKFGNTYLFPGQRSGVYINAAAECLRIDRCKPYTCSRHGSCVDLWDTFRCDCERPYWGKTCQYEYTAATFSKDGAPSLAAFDVNNLFSTSTDLDLSFFLRTRQNDSLIMYLTNGQTTADTLTYMTLEVQNGRLAARLHRCGLQRFFNESSNDIDQGALNFVHVKMEGNSLVAMVNRSVHINETISSAPGCNFHPTTAYFGYYPQNTNSRKRRQADPTTTLSHLPPFNGVLQDLELQGHKLDFESRPDAQSSNFVVMLSQESSNVTLGAESTLSVCNTSAPCQNGGTCSDVFFNDFQCECPKGYLGKDCSRPDFCEANSCPSWARCNSLQVGFECVSVATFDGDSSLVMYNPVLPSGISSQTISFNVRTRALYGVILEVRAGHDQNNFIKVRVRDGSLEVNYLLKESGFSSSMSLHDPINNGEWYKMEVIIDDDGMKLRLSQSGTIIQETQPQSAQQLDDKVTDLAQLINSSRVSILVGNVADKKEQAFRGCLEEVRIGGVLLPFMLDSVMNNNVATTKFSATTLPAVSPGCGGDDACVDNLCRNQGVCNDTWNDYTCDCDPSWEGRYCEVRASGCDAGPCLNGAKCKENVLGTFTCLCPPGYTGTRCQTQYDVCTNATCDNNSICVADSTVVGGYTCNCSDQDFTGSNCTISRVNKSCADSLCLNGATCTDDQNSSTFSCSCAAGFTGTLCDSVIDYCDGYPCNNGTCINRPTEQNVTCVCVQGFEGERCEINFDDCYSSPCQNGGTCEDGVHSYNCTCPEGWFGPNCEHDTNECDESPCQHGTCHNEPGSFSCDCSNTGYSGRNCQTEINECSYDFCVPSTTVNCTNEEGSYTCDCMMGYEGKNCSEARCEADLCLNGSTCDVIPSNWGTQWQCNCLPYFGGKQCDIAGPCASDPCNVTNTNMCIQDEFIDTGSGVNISSNFTCDCKEGWQGSTCSDDINECDASPCQNNATCQNSPGSYTCQCVAGYTGRHCENDIDECASNPCQNGATCTQGLDFFNCTCDQGFTGVNCESDVNECNNSTPCNNGTCSNTFGSFICDCGDAYLGDTCEYVNPCSSTVCSNGGHCNVTEQDSGYLATCTCVEGYLGDTCEQSPQTGDDGIDLAIIIGPVVAVILLIIIIAVIVFIFIARDKRATRGAYSPSRQETAGARVELGNVLKKPPEERLI